MFNHRSLNLLWANHNDDANFKLLFLSCRYKESDLLKSGPKDFA